MGVAADPNPTELIKFINASVNGMEVRIQILLRESSNLSRSAKI